VKTEEKQ